MEPNVVKYLISIFGGIIHLFTNRSVWSYFNKTCNNYSFPNPHDTGDILKVTGSKFKVTENFSDGVIPIDVAVEDNLVYFCMHQNASTIVSVPRSFPTANIPKPTRTRGCVPWWIYPPPACGHAPGQGHSAMSTH